MRSRPLLSRLTYAYLAAISLVALFALGGYGVSQIGRQAQREHLDLVRLSSRQPVLVERATLLVTLLTEPGAPEGREALRAQLRATAAELVANQQRLESAGLRLPMWLAAAVPLASGQPAEPPAVAPALHPFLAHLAALAAAPDAQLTLSQADRVAALAAYPDLAERLMAVERWYELVSRIDSSVVARLQLLTLLLVLGTLAGEALFIFRPLAHRLANEREEHYIAVESDITARKALEESLRASLKDLADVRFALDQTAIVAITDESGAILEANDMFCRISGYSRGELIGQSHRIVNSGYHDLAFWHNLWGTIGRGQIWQGEIRNRAKDGSLYWVDSTIVPFLDEAGSPTRYLAVRFDISERKRAEEALQASEATNRALLDALPDLMFRLSGDGRFLSHHTPRAQGLIMSPEAFLGRRISEAFPEDLAGGLMEAVRATIATGALQLVEYTLAHGDTLRDYEARMTPIGRDEVLVIVRDISDRKASERLKNEFVAMVSHELRTPLTAIRGSLGLIAGGVAGTVSAQARAMIDIAYKNSERLVRLINDILDIEKIESGKMSFHRQPLELGQLLAQTIEANRAYGAQFGVSFVLEPPPKAEISADADRMVQVFTNLLANAAKFSPRGEEVTVWARRHAGLVRVGVSDRGPGIPESFRDRIFQKFAQADSSSTREKGGTGLGLSIARAIVEHHGGRISFESEVGVGTTFVVELPEWHPVVERAAAPSAGRILVCEDDPDVAHLLKLVLQRAGFAVDVVYTAEDLHAQLSAGSYDVVTLDIRLQHQDGVDLIRELRAHEATAGLPIIVVSGLVDRARADLGDAAMGRIEWLPKPINSAMLVAAVTRAVRRAPSETPRILHIDSDPDIVQVVTSLISPLASVTHAASLADARARLAESHYDLALLDLVLPDGSGLEVLPLLQAGRPPIPAVVFSAHELDSALDDQVAASLVKSRVTNRELRDTITRLLAGQCVGRDTQPISEEKS